MDFHALPRKELQFLCKKNRIPANLTNVSMANALQTLETVEGIKEIQEALGFQSPNKAEVKSSPDLPHSGRISSRRAVLRDEPKIQQLSPFPQLRPVSIKAAQVTLLVSKEEGERREAKKVFPKTPAMKKTVKVVEAASSSKSTKEEEDNMGPSETPKGVELKKGKTVGMVTRRSTRLSSRKPVEETATVQSKSRRSSRANAAVNKMGPLGREDGDEHEKEEEKNDHGYMGDSCVGVLDEEDLMKKGREVESHVLSSSLDGEVVKIECENDLSDVLVDEKERKDQGEIHDSIHQLPANASMTYSRKQLPEDELMDDFSDQLAYNKPMKDLSVDKKYAEVSGEPLPGNVVLEISGDLSLDTLHDSIHHVPEAKDTICADPSEVVSCVTLPLAQEQTCYSDVEEEQKLSLLFFTETTLKDGNESGNGPPEARVAEDSTLKDGNANQLAANDSIDVTQKTEVSLDTVTFEPQLLDSSTELCTKFLIRDPSTEAPKESIEVDSKKAGETVINESIDIENVQHTSVSSTELCFELPTAAVIEHKEAGSDLPSKISDESVKDDLRKTAESVAIDMLQKTEISPGFSFEPQISVSSAGGLLFELSAADSSIEDNRESGANLFSEVTVVTDKSADDILETSELTTREPVDVVAPRDSYGNVLHQSCQLLPAQEFMDMAPQVAFFEQQISAYATEFALELQEIKEKPIIHGADLAADIATISSPPKKLLTTDETPLDSEESQEIKEKTIIHDADFAAGIIATISSPPNELLSTNETPLDSEEAASIATEISADIATISSPPKILLSTDETPLDSEESQEIKEKIIIHGADYAAGVIAAISSPPKKLLSTDETLLDSEEAARIATEISREKNALLTKKKLELLSLGKLKVLYKQKLNVSKNKPEMKNFMIKQDEFTLKLNGDNISKLERMKSVFKQEDSACLSLGKLDSNSKHKKLKDDEVNVERKRTPLKNLN